MLLLCVEYITCIHMFFIFFFKRKTAYEMRISDWSSDVCSSDLKDCGRQQRNEKGGHGLPFLLPVVGVCLVRLVLLTQQAVSSPRRPLPSERRRRRPPPGRRRGTAGEWPPAARRSPPPPATDAPAREPTPRGRVRSRCAKIGRAHV